MGASGDGSASPLTAILRRAIARSGPISIAAYMQAALGHRRHGYYMRGDPLGAGGDFTTAPEISQMFGELLGAWCIAVWEQLGRPDPVVLAELGPGRGTLMADLLRAARLRPTFLAALRLHLVETSPVLRRRQHRVLAAAHPDIPAHWHERFADVADGPLLLVANEFFDALPIGQYLRTAEGWRERRVGLADGDGARPFAFVLADPAPDAPPALPQALKTVSPGCVVEVRPRARDLMIAIGERLQRHGGAALVVDYGHRESTSGETLQAVCHHAFHHVLYGPGEADLTAHVDFAALAEWAQAAGSRAWGPLPQGAFLGHLGIHQRAAALAARAAPDQARAVAPALRRLVHPQEMGLLFKALALTPAAAPPPPGFAAG